LIGVNVLFDDKRRIIGKEISNKGIIRKRSLLRIFIKKESRGNPT
jgi:hypothetical protein